MKLNVYLNAFGKRDYVGVLRDQNRRIFFQYAPSFLKTGLNLSPFKLPLHATVFEDQRMTFDGLFGLFNDSLPDGWGCLLLDRKLLKQGLSYQTISPLHRLSLIGKNPMGALEYEPHEEETEAYPMVELDELSYEADKIINGQPGDVMDALLRLNGSSGGARPKIVAFVSDDKQHIVHGGTCPKKHAPWLIKFSNRSGRKKAGLEEYVYSLMAKQAGIDMPETHLFPSRTSAGHFGVKRFDRVGNEKRHIHTACGLLHASHRTASLDYENLLKLTLILTKDNREVLKMIRLMIFNVLAGNKDDHSKNFAFMMTKTGQWKLTPAYDLTKSEGINGEQTCLVNGKGRNITDDDFFLVAQKFGIDRKTVRPMIEQVKDSLASYRKLLTENA